MVKLFSGSRLKGFLQPERSRELVLQEEETPTTPSRCIPNFYEPDRDANYAPLDVPGRNGGGLSALFGARVSKRSGKPSKNLEMSVPLFVSSNTI